MAKMIQVAYPTIPLSGTVSGIFGAKGATAVSIWCPLVTSTQVLVQASFDQTSANFVRVQNSTGSGDWTYSAGVGSTCITLKDLGYFPNMRLETPTPQTGVVSFAVITQF